MSSHNVTKQKVAYVAQTDARYPSALSLLGNLAPAYFAVLGNVDLLHEDTIALFCSVRCPGSLILKAYDFAQNLRKTNETVISGFHSPVERECLNVLSKSTNKVIICPARGLERMRIPADYRSLFEQGRLLLLSPFNEKQRQASAEMAERRNQLVAALACHVFVTYAAPRSKTERLCRRIVQWEKPLFTFSGVGNNNLVEIGANALEGDFEALTVSASAPLLTDLVIE